MALNFKKPSTPITGGLIGNARKKVAELETKTIEEQVKREIPVEQTMADTFKSTYQPSLPFVPTFPTQQRLSFNQPKLIESDLPKTTKVSEPITGRTLGLDNVKTYQAPIGQSKKELDAKDKAEKVQAKETSETLEKELTKKYGFKVKRANSPIEYANILLKVPANQKEEFKKDYDAYILAVERSNPFRAGAEAGFNILPTNLEKTQGKEVVEEAKGFGTGRFVGGAGQQLAFNSVLGAPIEGLVGKVLPKATPFITETIKDVAIGTGTQLAEAPFDKPTATQFVGNMAMDIALNALFGAVGKGLSKIDLANIKTAKPQGVIQEVAKQMDINESQANDLIDRSIDVYVNQYGVADTKPFEQLQLPAPKGTEFKSDTFASTLRNKTNDIYVNQFGVADTKPFEQLQLDAPKNIVSDTSAARFRDGVQPQYKGADFKGDMSLTERKYPTANLGDRKIKAFQFNNPEVQPFYREKAEELLLDATYAKRGSRKGTLARDEFGEVVNRYGDPRVTTPQIARILDETGSKYEDIQKALQDLIDDNGKENHALAKKIENVIDDMLVEGYVNVVGETIKPNIRYIQLRNRLDTTKIPIPELEGPKASQLNNQLRMGGLDESGQRNVFDSDMQRTDFDDFLDASMPSIAKPTEGSVIKTDITADPFNEAQEDLFEQQLKESNEMIKKNLNNLEGETYRITSNKTKNSVIVSKRGNQIQATVMDKDYKPMMDRRFDTYEEFVKNFSQDPLIDGELKVSFEDYTPAVKPSLPQDFTIQKPQYPPLAKNFARETVAPKKPIAPQLKPNLQDITIQKPTFPSVPKQFAKETPMTIKPNELNLRALSDETTDPVFKKFRLDLFGATPEKPIKAIVEGKPVNVVSVKNNVATLSDGTNVAVKNIAMPKAKIEPKLKMADANASKPLPKETITIDDVIVRAPNLRDTGPSERFTKDYARITEKVFGKNTPEMKAIKQTIYDPFDASKGDYARNVVSTSNELYDTIVKGYGIKPRSKESALVMRFGEGRITEPELISQVGKEQATKIADASQWFRTKYDNYIDEINIAREQMGKPPVPKRQDYFRHFNEVANDFQAIKDMLQNPTNIDPNLAGISEYTKPSEKWRSIFQKRTDGTRFTEDAVGGFLDYIPAAEYAKNIDPHIKNFREFKDKLANATQGTRNLNNYLTYLEKFADDLAGKTSMWDRPFMEKVGRNNWNIINAINNRVKKNTILGNVSSSVSQILNLPNMIADVKDPEVILKAFGDFAKGNHEQLYKKSDFLSERFMNDSMQKFKMRLIDQPEKLAVWMLGALDEVGTKYIWSAEYNKALKQGIENPMRYADGQTRKMVAGRGIGEVPLWQKSKIAGIITPFTVEVNNSLNVVKDLLSEKDVAGLGLLMGANWLFNSIIEPVTGQRPLPDLIDAVQEGSQSGDTFGDKMIGTAGSVAGEVIGMFPGGQYAGAVVPEYGVTTGLKLPENVQKALPSLTSDEGTLKLPGRESLFAGNDPTRFMTGGAIPLVKGITDPLRYLALPFGGNQLSKSIEGAQSMGLLPQKVSTGDGFDFRKLPASVNQSGKIRTLTEPNALKTAQAVLFGQYSTPEVREYFDKKSTIYGKNQTANLIRLVDEGFEPKKLDDAVMKIRSEGITKKQEQLESLIKSGYSGKDALKVWAVMYGND